MISLSGGCRLSICFSLVAKGAEHLQIKWSLLHFFNLSTVSPPNVIDLSRLIILISLNHSEPLRDQKLSPQFHEGIIETTKRQLHTSADKRKARVARANNPAFAAEVDGN